MKFTLVDKPQMCGLDAEIEASYNQLKTLFGGPPNAEDDEDKCAGFAFVVAQGKDVAQLWCYKQGNPKRYPNKPYEWSVGSERPGVGIKMAGLIENALSVKG